MKYLKLFEYKKFRIGDSVYLADGEFVVKLLKQDVRYEIIDIVKNKCQHYFLKLKESPFNWFLEDRFVSELEYNASKYNL